MDLQELDYATHWLTAPEIFALCADTKNELKNKLSELRDVVQASAFSQIYQIAADSRASFATIRPYRMLIVTDHSENPQKTTLEIFGNCLDDLENRSESQWNTKYAFYSEINVPGKTAFVFPGQGSQYPFMGQELMLYFPEVRQALRTINEVFASEKKITEFIYPATTGLENEKVVFEGNLRSTDIAQPAIGVISVAMLKILARFNVHPVATCGHSFGELTALYGAGRIDESSFFSLAVARGKYMADAGGTGDKGGMLAVKAPLERINELISNSGVDVILANRNSPDQGVLSGPTDTINRMKDICKENKIRAVILPVAAAFHSRLVKDAAKPFENKIASTEFSESSMPVYSNTTGLPYPDTAKAAKEILGRHLLHPVNFIEEIQHMYENGHRVFIEVGPRTVLTGLVKSILKDQPIIAIAVDASSGRRSAITDIAKTLCILASVGYPVNLKKWKQI